MHYSYDYEDEFAQYDEEEQFQKIKKKGDKKPKTINQKDQIRQQRRKKNKNKEAIEKQNAKNF